MAHEQSQEIEKVKKEAVERVVVVGREKKLRNVSWSASFVLKSRRRGSNWSVWSQDLV